MDARSQDCLFTFSHVADSTDPRVSPSAHRSFLPMPRSLGKTPPPTGLAHAVYIQPQPNCLRHLRMSRRRGECQVDHEALHCWGRAGTSSLRLNVRRATSKMNRDRRSRITIDLAPIPASPPPSSPKSPARLVPRRTIKRPESTARETDSGGSWQALPIFGFPPLEGFPQPYWAAPTFSITMAREPPLV